jgi:prophage DNA circulation protein
MSHQKVDSFTVGLSEAEKDDLEKMLGEFRREPPMDVASAEEASVQSQLDRITRRLADLTEKVLHLDRQMAPLMEIIRLSHQKSELLSQRLDAVIAALKKGRMI